MQLRQIVPTILLVTLLGVGVFFVFWNFKVEKPPTVFNKNNSEQQRAFILPISETNYLPIRNFNIAEPVIDAKAAILFDSRSGRVLYSLNSNQRLPIASITKLMSAVVILENMSLDQIYTIPIEDVNVDGLGVDLYKDEQFHGKDLFKIMLIKSSNDAASTFATTANKSGIDFIGKMNEKAVSLRMTDTVFTNSAGLDDHDAFSTAADLVKLVNYIRKYDIIWETLRIKSTEVLSLNKISHHLINTDQLLGEIPRIIGGKTGYTNTALGTMVLLVGLNDNKDSIISVILGSNNRFGETKKLIDWGERAYSWK